MDNWYYATAGGQRHGPLSAAELRALAAAGGIDARTLLWRDGEANWRPLQDFAAELELPLLPPPVPAPAATQPPPRNLPGCVIALLVVVAGVFVVGLLGIVAAIALPAYQDYVQRAKVSGVLAQVKPLQLRVAESLQANGHCPRNGEEDFGTPESYAQGSLASVTVGKFDESGLCGLEARIAAPGKPALDGKAIWLEYRADGGAWDCSSELADRLLPRDCRG